MITMIVSGRKEEEEGKEDRKRNTIEDGGSLAASGCHIPHPRQEN